MEKQEEKHFIKTQHQGTKKTLLALGYKMISDDGFTATFINEPLVDEFSGDQKKHMSYTNKLTF